MSRNGGDPLVAFIGNALMGIGAIVTALCGSCTLLAGVSMAAERLYDGPVRPFLDYVLTLGTIGVLPTATGLGLYLGGRSLARSARKEPT